MKPRASRPHMPGYGIADARAGKGLLKWKWATDRLEKGRTYWLATARPDGRPHVMPVWGVWFGGAFYFSTGKESRKAKNLAANPTCSVAVEIDFKKQPKKDDIKDSVVVEGSVELLRDAKIVKKFSKIYEEKYGWDMEGFAEPIYCIRPRVVFGFTSSFNQTATRWLFA